MKSILALLATIALVFALAVVARALNSVDDHLESAAAALKADDTNLRRHF